MGGDLLLLEQERSEMNQVVAPDEPGVEAGSLNLRDRHLLCLEVLDEFAVGFDEIVFRAAGDPEKAKIGCLRVQRRQLLSVIEIVDRRTKAADPGELAGVGEADFEAFQATHREAGDGAIVAVFGDVVFGLDTRHHFGEQRLGKEIRIVIDCRGVVPDVVRVEKGEIALAEGHDDNHRLDLARGEEIVEDQIRLANGTPSSIGVAPAMEKIEDRVRLLRLLVVARWRVDEIGALVFGKPEDCSGRVDVTMQATMGNVGVFPRPRAVASHSDQVGDAHQIDRGVRVVGIKTPIAVGFKVIGVDLRRQRLGGVGPDPGRIFLHRDRLGNAVEGKHDLSGCGILIREGDPVVRVDLGGTEMRGSLGGQRERS